MSERATITKLEAKVYEAYALADEYYELNEELLDKVEKLTAANKALKAALKTVIYQHAEAEHTIVKLRYEIDKIRHTQSEEAS
jgi:septal ring factor EnvC (AmiA/AmiB activator)